MMKEASDIREGLLGKYAEVPYATEPLWWDRRLGVPANLLTIRHYMEKYAPSIPAGCVFDEAAVMVPTPIVHEMLTKDLLAAGWELFNEAADLVFTNPFGTRYTVEYTFFRHLAWPFRIEVMLLGQPAGRDQLVGFSPLHQALWYPNGDRPNWASHAEFPIPHLSFKVAEGMKFGQATDLLRGSGFVPAQVCQSTYGVFGYFIHNDAMRQVYVKPRINRRDEVAK